MMSKHNRTVFAATAAVAAVFTLGIFAAEPAEACEPPIGELAWGWPEDGSHVPPDFEFFLVYTGIEPNEDNVELTGSSGETYDVAIESVPEARFGAAAHIIRPDDDLEDNELTLRFEPELEHADDWEVSVTTIDVDWEVGWDQTEVSDPVWYRQLFDDKVEMMCVAGTGSAGQIHYANAQVEDLPDDFDHRFRLVFEQSDDDARVFNFDEVPDEDSLTWLLDDDVECVSFEVIRPNGMVVADATNCIHDRCTQTEAAEFSRPSDIFSDRGEWEELDGCDADPMPKEDPYADEDEQEEIDPDESACQATAGTPAVLWVAAALLGLVGLRSRGLRGEQV